MITHSGYEEQKHHEEIERPVFEDVVKGGLELGRENRVEEQGEKLHLVRLDKAAKHRDAQGRRIRDRETLKPGSEHGENADAQVPQVLVHCR